MQTINLLSQLPEKKIYLPGWMIGRLILVIVASLILISCCIELNYLWQYFQLREVGQQRLTAAQAFQKVARKYPLIAQGDPLDERVEVMAEKLAIKNKMWGRITRSALSQGFVAYMKAFASQTPKGVWLERIYIDQSKHEISLSGGSLRPALVPQMMQDLKQSTLFQTKLFKLFVLEKNVEQAYLNFQIATKNLLGKDDVADTNTTEPEPPENNAKQLTKKVFNIEDPS